MISTRPPRVQMPPDPPDGPPPARMPPCRTRRRSSSSMPTGWCSRRRRAGRPSCTPRWAPRRTPRSCCATCSPRSCRPWPATRDFAEVTREVLARWGLADRAEDVLAFWTRLELDARGHRAHPRAAGRRRRLLPGHQPARAAPRLHVHEPRVRRAAGRPAVLLRPRRGQAGPGLLHRRPRAHRLPRRVGAVHRRPRAQRARRPHAPVCAPRSSTSPPAPTRCARILATHGLL